MADGKAYVDPEKPGIVRFHGADQFDGLLAGTRSALIVKRFNAYPKLVEKARAIVAAWNAIPDDVQVPDVMNQGQIEALAALLKELNNEPPAEAE